MFAPKPIVFAPDPHVEAAGKIVDAIVPIRLTTETTFTSRMSVVRFITRMTLQYYR